VEIIEMMILDTTLRDGSYALNFGFTAAQTRKIVGSLSGFGIPLIEVGHGVGIGASRIPEQRARESDEIYMKAAEEAIGTAKWGMFAIPGIASNDDVRLLLDSGAGFIRIGVPVDSLQSAQQFIDLSKKAGVFVCINFMKSYSSPPDEFGLVAREAITRGADVVYVVDSAGSMNPDQLRHYFEELEGLPFGFHAHNNLGLANANSLAAFWSGASILDCSLQGLGRSSGNAVTEQMVALMQQLEECQQIDLLGLMDFSEDEVRPLLPRSGVDSLDLISGFSGFHTSYMGSIKRWSSEYQVDPRILIMELCKITRTSAPDELLSSIAERCSREKRGQWFGRRSSIDSFFGDEQRNL